MPSRVVTKRRLISKNVKRKARTARTMRKHRKSVKKVMRVGARIIMNTVILTVIRTRPRETL